jgi:hypothetical protein
MLVALVMILGVVGVALLLRPWPFFLPREQDSDGYHDRNVAVEFVKWVERQALARGLNVRGVARPVPLECKKCGKSSNYFVYPDEICEKCWKATFTRVPAPTKEHIS